jgi:hypothetical protein
VDVTAPVDATPGVAAAADTGAPFEFITGLAVSPVTGITYVSDPGVDPASVPRIHAVDCAGTVSTVVAGGPLSEPGGLGFLPDGRLVITDLDADPSALGPDSSGGAGHGALFVVDVLNCTPPCTPSLLSDGTSHSFGGGFTSAFEDPFDVAYDAVTERLEVVDLQLPGGGLGSLLAVDPSTGKVDLVSAPGWEYPVGVAVRSNGHPLVCDAGLNAGTSSAWDVDPTIADPLTNATLLTGGAQYAQLEDVTRDASGQVYLVDWGEYDQGSGTFITPPAIWRVDESNPNPLRNGVLVNESVDLITPLAATPLPDCAPPQGLAINRRVTSLATPLMRLQFLDVACRQPPWLACPDQIVAGPADGMRLSGEAAASATPSLRLYEHSDPIATLRVERSGSDLVIRVR